MNDESEAAKRPFRFFDNREKYLMFVTTCGEKWAIAEQVGAEMANIAWTVAAQMTNGIHCGNRAHRSFKVRIEVVSGGYAFQVCRPNSKKHRSS